MQDFPQQGEPQQRLDHPDDAPEREPEDCLFVPSSPGGNPDQEQDQEDSYDLTIRIADANVCSPTQRPMTRRRLSRVADIILEYPEGLEHYVNTIFRDRMEVVEGEARMRQSFTFVPSWVATMMAVMAAAPSATPVWENEEPVVRGGGEVDMTEYNAVLEKIKKWEGMKITNLPLLKTLLKAEGSLIRRVSGAKDVEAARQLLHGAAHRVGVPPPVEIAKTSSLKVSRAPSAPPPKSRDKEDKDGKGAAKRVRITGKQPAEERPRSSSVGATPSGVSHSGGTGKGSGSSHFAWRAQTKTVKNKEVELLADEWSSPVVKEIKGGQDGVVLVNSEEEAMKVWRTARDTQGASAMVAKMRYPEIPEDVCSEVLFRVKDVEAAMDGTTTAPRALKGVLIQLGKTQVTRKLEAAVEIESKGKSSTVMIAELHKNFVKPDVWVALSSLHRYKGLLQVLRVMAAPSKVQLSTQVENALETYVAKNGGEKDKDKEVATGETAIMDVWRLTKQGEKISVSFRVQDEFVHELLARSGVGGVFVRKISEGLNLHKPFWLKEKQNSLPTALALVEQHGLAGLITGANGDLAVRVTREKFDDFLALMGRGQKGQVCRLEGLPREITELMTQDILTGLGWEGSPLQGGWRNQGLSAAWLVRMKKMPDQCIRQVKCNGKTFSVALSTDKPKSKKAAVKVWSKNTENSEEPRGASSWEFPDLPTVMAKEKTEDEEATMEEPERKRSRSRTPAPTHVETSQRLDQIEAEAVQQATDVATIKSLVEQLVAELREQKGALHNLAGMQQATKATEAGGGGGLPA